MAQAMTVRGPIEADELDVTLPHEHLLWDIRNWMVAFKDISKMHLVDSPISLETLADSSTMKHIEPIPIDTFQR